MNEFILIVVIYMNSSGGGFQIIPNMGEYPDKAQCEEYKKQVVKDLAEPSRTLRATCMPKSAISVKEPQAKAPVKK